VNHFDKFLEIYCDKSFKLRKDTYLVQEYESKSEESFFNFLVKQKIKQRILEVIESKILIPSQLFKLFSKKQQENYDKERVELKNVISKRNKHIERIIKELDYFFKKIDKDFYQVVKDVGSENIDDTFQIKYSNYTKKISKVRRTRQCVIDFLKKSDCFSGIFFVLIWGGHKESSLLNVLNYFEDNKEKLNEVTVMLREASHSPEEVYSTLKDVKGLGPAYFTKILYFYTHAFDKKWNHKSYIMDQFTSKSMNLLRMESKKYDINLSQDYLKVKDSLDNNTSYSMYKNYNKDIEKLVQFFQEKGNKNVNADIIEVMLFGDSNKKSSTPFRKWRLYTNQAYQKEF
tara:strand:+ start:54 stop:1085 length:1032 start_codon:yes stop_codon:yes gene_type:complete